MKNMFKFSVVLALVLAIVGAYGVFTNAKASAGSAASALGNLHGPLTASAATALKKTRLVEGESFASLPAGAFTLIDGTNLACPGTSGTCTYVGDNHQQIAASAQSNWTLLTTIDGNFIGDGGPYLGQTSGTDFSAASWEDFASGISFGSHSIQTYVYMRDQSATAYFYNFDYKVYKP